MRQKISRYVDVDRNEKLKEVLHSMSGLGMSIYEKGQRQGMQQGILQGIQQGMQRGIQQGMQQGIAQGMQQGEEKQRRLIREKMILAGMPLEQIEAILAQ